MTDSALKTRINDAVKDAMRAQDKPRRDALRLIMAEMKRIEVDERVVLDDARVVAILDRMAKQRRESIQQFEQAGRQDLVDSESAELAVIQEFLPRALEESELEALIDAAIASTGASGIKDMGKVMGVLKPQVQGRADMAAVSQCIKVRLGA